MAARISNLEGYRKWSVMASIVVLAAVFRHLSYISGAEWVHVMEVTVVAFFGTNLSEHAIKAYKDIKSTVGSISKGLGD
jgi:hypothetical protein